MMLGLGLEFWRVAYVVLAFLAMTGFVATLTIRWDELNRGERILRFGLICEHGVIMYGGVWALRHHAPGSIVAQLLTVSLLFMLTGFADWILNDLVPRHRRRL